MSHGVIYQTLGIEGHQHRSMAVGEGRVLIRVTMQEQDLCCPGCGSRDIARRAETREFKAQPIASKPVCVLVDVPRLECPLYETVRQAKGAFAAPGAALHAIGRPALRSTEFFVRYVIALRR